VKTKVYRCSNPFREVKVATSKIACFINTPNGAIQVERIEAANAIRYARVKGSVSLIK
jgi:Pyruvate/2-oxoacid:ferredoxin oxidoreductase delta subunit